LISFDSIELDDENDGIKRKLYDLFFAWRAQPASTAGHGAMERIVVREDGKKVLKKDEDTDIEQDSSQKDEKEKKNENDME